MNSSYFRSFSSTKQSSEDMLAMMHQATEQPLVRALAEFMNLNDFISQIDIRYLLRSAAFNIETVNPPTALNLFKTFRVRHVNHLAELSLISSRALGFVCDQSLSSLTELSLENCVNINSRVTQAISGCHLLKSANFSFSRLDEEGLGVIVEGCKDLKVLILRGVLRLGPNSLSTLGKTKVEILDLSHSPNIVGQQPISQSLQTLPLSQLSLNGIDIQDSDLAHLHTQTTLKLLSLSSKP